MQSSEYFSECQSRSIRPASCSWQFISDYLIATCNFTGGDPAPPRASSIKIFHNQLSPCNLRDPKILPQRLAYRLRDEVHMQKLKIMKKHLTQLIAAGCLLTAPAIAEKPNPYMKENDTWISINGEVSSVSPDTFELNYGDGLVTVEMDDWDADADAYKLLRGDKVTVNGKIDDDFFESTTIEASSVYVEGLNTYFYASPEDEDDRSVSITAPLILSTTTVQGEVEAIDDRNFILDSGLRSLTVDTTGLEYNPLDEKGYQQIDEGDIVSVTGLMDTEFFGERELDADTVITLMDS